MGATRWTDWCEWKAQCALARCGEETRGRLAAFGLQRLRAVTRRLAPLTNLPDGAARRLPDDPVLAWHLFEAHAVTTRTRAGKAYKEWLFARAGAAGHGAAALESGAALMLRDVARTFLSRECLRAGTLPLDAPVAGCRAAGDTPTYRDLLPDTFTPVDALAARELASLADTEARTLFEALPRQERVGLAAKYLGISLGHPKVLALCACGRSMLSRRVHRVFEGLPERLTRYSPDDCGADLRTFCVEVMRALERRTVSWVRVESVLPELFGRRDGDDPGRAALAPLSGVARELP